MKNNQINSSQFYFSAFLSVFTALLFIDLTSSYQQIIYVAIALIINYIVIKFQIRKINTATKIILWLYLLVFSIAVFIEMTIFMNSAIKSGPYWVIVLIISASILFTAIKGVEALSRAAVIISFFVVLFLMYIFSSTVGSLNINEFRLNFTTSFLPSLIVLSPSAFYSLSSQKINDNRNYPLIIYTLGTFLTVGYMIFISSSVKNSFPLYSLLKNSHLGVFKGADFMLLTLITIGVIYFISLTVCSVTFNSKSKYFCIIPLLLISGITLLSMYFREFRSLLISQNLLSGLTILMILALIFNTCSERLKNYRKNYNKSKKS